MVACTVTACESIKGEGPFEQPDPNQGKVTLTIQYPKPSEEDRMKMIDDRIERFKREYPSVEIRKNDWHYTDGGLSVLMAANDAPSFYNTWATEANYLIELGYAADLTPFLNNYEFADEFNPFLLNVFTQDGKIYAIPDSGYVMSIGINKKIFREKGVPLPGMDWTWDELIETAKKVNDPQAGIAGFGVAGQTNAAGWHLTNFIYQTGENVLEIRDGEPVVTFNSEKTLKALDFYHQLRWDAQVLPRSWALSNSDLDVLWKQGRLAMVLNPGALYQSIYHAGWEQEDVAVYPLPSMEKGTFNTAVTGGNFFVINPQRPVEEQEMAFKFITFDLFRESGLEWEENLIKSRIEEGQKYIPNLITYYNNNSQYSDITNELFTKYKEHVWEWDPEFLQRYNKHAKSEPPFYAQNYYAVMTEIIQIAFTDRSANLKFLLDEGAHKFQNENIDIFRID